MNKELTPLKAHKELKSRYGKYFSLQDDERGKVIETALKDYEKKTKLAKEYADVDNVAKRLKALEIIKDKEWFDDFMKEHLTREWFTKDELDLLKEVLL